jgi:uncharacterized protein YjgD (DUF1641 family)
MAKPVDFRPVPKPPFEETLRKLEQAPLDHAEAVLNAYRTLQMLHDSDALDFIRGLLGAGDTVLNESVAVLTSPAAVRSLRNLLVLVNILGEIDPEVLHSLADTITPLLKPNAPRPKPLSVFSLVGKVFSRDVRLVLGIGLLAIEGLGRGIGHRDS